MKYILNETPVRTTEHAKINNIVLDLDIPKIDKFSSYKVKGISYNEYDKDNFISGIGFKFDKSHNLDIDVDSNEVYIEYDIIENILVDNININILKDIKTNITIRYNSKNNIYHILKLNINLEDNSNANINLINLVSRNSKSFIDIESNINESSKCDINLIDIGGNIKVNRYYSNVNGKHSICNFNNVYLASDTDIVDMNYYTALYKQNDESYINVSGALMGNASKNFKGTIDFIAGASKSIGKELEKVTLLSDTVITRSLPMLLCHEEDVEGAHGVSTGKIDNEKLFYMMSRGVSLKEAIKLILVSEFDIALSKLNDSLKDELKGIIEDRLN